MAACAATWAAGGPILWYLGAEFNPAPSGGLPLFSGAFGPVAGAFAQLASQPQSLVTWAAPIAAFAAAGGTFLLRQFRRSGPRA
jgi:hypothetical protein